MFHSFSSENTLPYAVILSAAKNLIIPVRQTLRLRLRVTCRIFIPLCKRKAHGCFMQNLCTIIDFPVVRVYFRDMRFPRCDMKPAAEGFYCQCIGCTAIAEGGACILVQEKEGVYRYNGSTPHGGEYAYLYFTDSAGNLTPREKASYVEVREMDQKGDTLHINFGIVDDMGFSIKKP